MNYVYILLCGDKSLYTGWTNTLLKRIDAHNMGKGAKYTKGRGPCKLVYIEMFEDKGVALRREIEIKKLPRKKKLKLILDQLSPQEKTSLNCDSCSNSSTCSGCSGCK